VVAYVLPGRRDRQAEPKDILEASIQQSYKAASRINPNLPDFFAFEFPIWKICPSWQV
jgi:hypothetical protein